MTQIKAVVFDSDGTLLDSFELIVAAYRHVALLHGLRPPTANEVRAMLGKSVPDIYRAFYPQEDIDKLVRSNSAFIAEHVNEANAFAGLEDLLSELQAMGLKLAILTGGNHKIHEMLAHHNIEHYFTSIVHCDRVAVAKPDPEGLLLAAKECGVRPDEVAMVGDTINDIMAGKNAHVALTIGVSHGYGSLSELKQAGADWIADSLAEVQIHLQNNFSSI